MDIQSLYSSTFPEGISPEGNGKYDIFKAVLQDLHKKSFIWIRFSQCRMISASITPLGEEFKERLLTLEI
jgi:hypothetical protein